MVSNDAIVKEAKQKAIDMLTKAQQSSKEIKSATNTYVNNVLSDTEKFLQNSLQNVKTKQEITQVKSTPQKQMRKILLIDVIALTVFKHNIILKNNNFNTIFLTSVKVYDKIKKPHMYGSANILNVYTVRSEFYRKGRCQNVRCN